MNKDGKALIKKILHREILTYYDAGFVKNSIVLL